MSWLFSQALVAEYSAATCWDGAQSAPLSVMPTQHKFWRNDKTMDASQLSRFGLTCAVLTEDHGEALLTWFREGSHVKTYHRPGKALALREIGHPCGNTWRALSAMYDLDSFSWKTARCLLNEDLPWSSVILPNWGICLHGELFQRVSMVPITKEKGYGSRLPTPSGVNRGSSHVMGRLDEWGGPWKSTAWNRNWEVALREFRGMDDGMAYGVERTDTIRNGQVPVVAATAFAMLTQSLDELLWT